MSREATVRATEYRVCAYPGWEDEPYGEAASYIIWVRRRNDGRWVVEGRCDQYLSIDGAWDRPPVGDGPNEQWRATHRFDLETALALAKQAAPHIKVGGRSIDDMLAFVARRRSGGAS